MLSKVLVTGGAGFIGSKVVKALLKLNYEVLVVDNLSTGIKENLPKDAQFTKLDILDRSIIEVIKTFKPNCVIHLAAQSNVKESVNNVKRDLEINTSGTINLLDASIVTGVDNFVFTSTAAVYGEQDELPISEGAPLLPISPYGISKMSAEKYIQYYNKKYSLPYTILRLSNVYGADQHLYNNAGVIEQFINKLSNDEQPIIHGNGNQTRDFIHVEDVVNAILKSANIYTNSVINISTGHETSITNLLNIIESKIERKITPYAINSNNGEINRSSLNPEESFNLLKWSPIINIVKGIEKTIDMKY